MTPDEQLDHTAVSRGKYSGRTPDQIAQRDASYLVWMYENWTPKPCSALLYRECRKDLAESQRSERVSRDQDRE